MESQQESASAPEPREPTPVGALATAQHIGRTIAARYADEVDSKARFPSEALAAIRQAQLLAAAVPVKLGGLGCSLAELAVMCQGLAQGCAATGMIFAMHQIQVGCLIRHGGKTPFWGRYLRQLAAEQRLIASVTSEVGVGGSLRESVAAVELYTQGCELKKQAPTVSYGLQADDLLITARRSQLAAPGDQVLVLAHRSQCTLEQKGSWDTLGMRGTCSPAFAVSARFAAEQILTPPFAEIAAHTMVPLSHILWSSCWLGIATDAIARARVAVQAEARRSPGIMPPAALRLAELSELLQRMRAGIGNLIGDYERLRQEDPESLTSVGFALRVNQLKLASSQLVVDIVSRALAICGIAGYRSDTKVSVGRHLRDAHSAPLMIANDRILATNAALLLIHKGA